MVDNLIVTSPVTDLRADRTFSSKLRGKDPLQETQLLFHDVVRLLKRDNEWVYVEVPNQPVFDKDHGWRAYRGWVHSNDVAPISHIPVWNAIVTAPWATVNLDGKSLPLTLGTHLHLIGTNTVRLFDGRIGTIDPKDVSKPSLDVFFTLLGHPYLWGGLSCYNPSSTMLTGFDCSALVYLYYRQQGITIPRNAGDQFRIFEPIDPHTMKRGDLIFMRSLTTNKLNHVMMYLGDGELLESTMSSNSIRIVKVEKRLGCSLEAVRIPHQFEGHEFYFAKGSPHSSAHLPYLAFNESLRKFS